MPVNVDRQRRRIVIPIVPRPKRPRRTMTTAVMPGEPGAAWRPKPIWGDAQLLRPAPTTITGEALHGARVGRVYALGQEDDVAADQETSLDRETVAELLDAIDTIMKAYNAKRDIECLNVLMEEGPQNVAKLRGRMNSWLQTAEEGAMWPVDPGGVERAIQMIDCAETLRQIIPGIPNAVTYGGGAASAIGLAVLLL